MKRFLIIIFNLSLLFLMTSCSKAEEPVRVAMLVSEKVLFENNPFYEGVWEGINKYCEENNITYDKYTAEYKSEEQLRKILSDAVTKGAELVVMPGYFFQELALEGQEIYPDINFIILDSSPNNGLKGEEYREFIRENTLPVMFAEEQAGFLAGYSVVMDGYRDLGFFGGMSVPAVMRFGYGYAQGAEFAARKLGLGSESINLRYIYCGGFVASPEIQARADLWYLQGTEVIFSCGGGISQSVIPAAENAGKYIVGVDNDQSTLSTSIITSAIKQVENATYNTVDQYFKGNFVGGNIQFFGVNENSIGLPMENSRFQNFTTEEYNEIYEALVTNQNNIASNIRKDDVAPEELPLDCVLLQMETMK